MKYLSQIVASIAIYILFTTVVFAGVPILSFDHPSQSQGQVQVSELNNSSSEGIIDFDSVQRKAILMADEVIIPDEQISPIVFKD